MASVQKSQNIEARLLFACKQCSESWHPLLRDSSLAAPLLLLSS